MNNYPCVGNVCTGPNGSTNGGGGYCPTGCANGPTAGYAAGFVPAAPVAPVAPVVTNPNPALPAATNWSPNPATAPAIGLPQQGPVPATDGGAVTLPQVPPLPAIPQR